MAKQAKIRFGAIGCGNMGTHRIKQMVSHELGVELVAAVDIDPPRLDNLANVIGSNTFARYTGVNDYKRMIDENELDAVGIFTPHIPHYDHLKYALQKGRNVLIEKPMVCGAANALEVTKLAKEKGVTALLTYQRHYELKFMKARELIAKGAIGEVTNFFVYMAQDWCGRTWRGDPKYSGGGQINDSGSHYQDILLWMTGLLPVSAEGYIDSIYRGKKLKVEYNGSFNVELTGGVSGRVVILSDIPGGFVDDVRICGTKGSIFFRGDQVILFDQEANEYTEVSLSRPAGYPLSPVDNFVKLLRKKVRINRVPFIFGSRVALLTEAMLRSGHQKGKKILCADILKESNHTMADLED
ncbi:MAG: Gfo/Idh/MocA family protein [Lentisphaeria bacterium]|jgi:predicted dehydrogenase